MIGLLVLGCASGSIDTPDGREVLRTALLADVSEGGRAALVLSNGTFGCELPDPEDPLAASEALFAACREGARHVVVDLEGDPGSYRGLSADFIEVIEAAVRSEDGLVRELVVSERAVHDTAVVELDWTGEARGRFELPELGVSGRFAADRCPADSSLFAAVAALEALSCP